MTKLKAMIVGSAVFTLLLILPLAAMAQPLVSGFFGSVTLDGASVPNGTVVKALIDLVVVQSATTTNNSQYVMYIVGSYTGKTVFFTIGTGDALAVESTIWEAGGNKSVNINGLTVPDAVGEASITLSPAQGAVTVISGIGFTPTAKVSFTWEGQAITVQPATVTVSTAGLFSSIVIAPTSTAGNYTVRAIDDRNRSAQTVFNVTVPSKGDKGDTGPAGPAGAAGPSGVQGTQGTQGSSGDPGLAGPAGAPGATGQPGLIGNPGVSGPMGNQGPKGDSGPAGPAGQDGSSGAGSTLALVAIVLSAIAIIIAFLTLSRLARLIQG